MLVLTRKLGQRIRIGNSVIITVLQISGGTVRLGIEAPREMEVLREELLARACCPPAASSPSAC